MRLFVARAYSAQYERSGARRGLVELDELEAAREGRVFFKVFFVFLPRRRGAGLYLAARERGLHEVRGVGASGLSARAYEHVRLVDEKDYRLFARLYLVEHALEAAFELALDARARFEQPHVEREQRGALYRVGHVALHDAQRESLEDGGLSDARLADEYRVVFAAARQYVHHLADFRVASENWVYLPRLGLRREVLAEFRYEALAALRSGPSLRGGRVRQDYRGLLGFARYLREVLEQIFAVYRRERLRVIALSVDGGLAQERKQHRAGAYLAQPEVDGGDEPRRLHQLDEQRREYRASAVAVPEAVHRGVERALNLRGVRAEGFERYRDVALRLRHAGEQQVLYRHLVVSAPHRAARGVVQRHREKVVAFFKKRGYIYSCGHFFLLSPRRAALYPL